VSFDEHCARFRYKDYAAANRRKVMRLDAQEFIRRYLLHVLPNGFMRIRHYGLLGSRSKHRNLAQARSALNLPQPEAAPAAPETLEALWLRIARVDIHRCPHCASGRLLRIARLAPRAHCPPA
jgi:Putative transposase